MLYRTDSTLVDRFWKKVNKNGPSSKNVAGSCWLWTAATNNYGYGSFWTKEGTKSAHRLSLELSGIQLSPDEHVCHHCDNPLCVNPNHLFVSDVQGNLDDMVIKSRCVSPLNSDQILSIRDLYETGRYSMRKLANKFGVHHSTIFGIVHRRHWKVI